MRLEAADMCKAEPAMHERQKVVGLVNPTFKVGVDRCLNAHAPGYVICSSHS